MPNIIYKKLLMCDTAQNVTLDFSPYSVNWFAQTISKPGPVNPYVVNGSVTSYFIPLSVSNGTITIKVTDGSATGTLLGYFDIDINTTCYEVTDVCCEENALNIRWLSVSGAIKEWVFYGMKTFDIRIGDAVTFKNSNYQLLYAQRNNIYTGKLISSGDISKSQADYLDELQYSIQAWEWDGTNATPIIVDNASFTKYQSTDKFFSVNLKYALAEEIVVQTQ